MFLQSYTQASRHSTTILRYHHSQTRDVSNISNKDAVKYFPDDIFLLSLMNASSPSLLKIPHFLSKDSQDFSHLFSRPCKTTLSNMEIWVRQDKEHPGAITIQGLWQNPNPRRDPIVLITLRHLIPMPKPRLTTILTTSGTHSRR